MSLIREEIEKEMRICECEIWKARADMARCEERANLFDDRKTMLFGFLQILDSEEKAAGKEVSEKSEPKTLLWKDFKQNKGCDGCPL